MSASVLPEMFFVNNSRKFDEEKAFSSELLMYAYNKVAYNKVAYNKVAYNKVAYNKVAYNKVAYNKVNGLLNFKTW